MLDVEYSERVDGEIDYAAGYTSIILVSILDCIAISSPCYSVSLY